MSTLEKAIQTFGFESSITITIGVLEEQGLHKLAEQLYEECATEVYEDNTEETDEEFDVIDADTYYEMGFDPYEGCYTYDC